jgi:integrase
VHHLAASPAVHITPSHHDVGHLTCENRLCTLAGVPGPGAARIVRWAARRAGITKPVGPHTLRHAFITAALDAGVPLRDVQEAASDADPRTTIRYDRARTSLDRHATCIAAAFVAGAAR